MNFLLFITLRSHKYLFDCCMHNSVISQCCAWSTICTCYMHDPYWLILIDVMWYIYIYIFDRSMAFMWTSASCIALIITILLNACTVLPISTARQHLHYIIIYYSFEQLSGLNMSDTESRLFGGPWFEDSRFSLSSWEGKHSLDLRGWGFAS